MKEKQSSSEEGHLGAYLCLYPNGDCLPSPYPRAHPISKVLLTRRIAPKAQVVFGPNTPCGGQADHGDVINRPGQECAECAALFTLERQGGDGECFACRGRRKELQGPERMGALPGPAWARCPVAPGRRKGGPGPGGGRLGGRRPFLLRQLCGAGIGARPCTAGRDPGALF